MGAKSSAGIMLSISDIYGSRCDVVLYVPIGQSLLISLHYVPVLVVLKKNM